MHEGQMKMLEAGIHAMKVIDVRQASNMAKGMVETDDDEFAKGWGKIINKCEGMEDD